MSRLQPERSALDRSAILTPTLSNGQEHVGKNADVGPTTSAMVCRLNFDGFQLASLLAGT